MQQVAVKEGLFSHPTSESRAFEAGGPPFLLGGRCPACTRYHFPSSTICPWCSHEPVEEVSLSPTGRLWAWTTVNSAPPGYQGPVPYGFGVVELDEGLRIVTRITETDPAALELEQKMQLVLVPLYVDDEGREVVTYAFAPAALGATSTDEDRTRIRAETGTKP
jgi:uncharacterized protein